MPGQGSCPSVPGDDSLDRWQQRLRLRDGHLEFNNRNRGCLVLEVHEDGFRTMGSKKQREVENATPFQVGPTPTQVFTGQVDSFLVLVGNLHVAWSRNNDFVEPTIGG